MGRLAHRPPPGWLSGGLGTLLLCLLMLGGWRLAGAAAQEDVAPGTVTRHGTIVTTDVVTRKTKGRVITLPGGTKVIHVPLIIVHTDHKTIRVPAHNLPFHKVKRGLSAAVVAEPLVPVTVTVYIPAEPVTVTVTETLPPSTETVTIPTTITLPINPTTSDQGGATDGSTQSPQTANSGEGSQAVDSWAPQASPHRPARHREPRHRRHR